MEEPKSRKEALAMALAIRRHANKRKMADGGMIESENQAQPMSSKMADRQQPSTMMGQPPKSIAASILSKRMSKGGMVTLEEDEDISEQPDHNMDDDFLTADHELEMPMEEPKEDRRSRLERVMAGLSKRHMGK